MPCPRPLWSFLVHLQGFPARGQLSPPLPYGSASQPEGFFRSCGNLLSLLCRVAQKGQRFQTSGPWESVEKSSQYAAPQLSTRPPLVGLSPTEVVALLSVFFPSLSHFPSPFLGFLASLPK